MLHCRRDLASGLLCGRIHPQARFPIGVSDGSVVPHVGFKRQVLAVNACSTYFAVAAGCACAHDVFTSAGKRPFGIALGFTCKSEDSAK